MSGTRHPRIRICVVGEALIDEIRHGRDVVAHVGGSPATVARGLGLLGHRVSLVTTVGDDEYGQLIARSIRAAGVVLVNAGDPSAPTSVARATIAEDGSSRYEFDVTWAPRPSLLPPADVLHVGSYSIALQPGADEVAHWMRAAPDAVVTFDPNIRPALLTSRARAVERVEAIVDVAQVVKASDEDLRWLFPNDVPWAVARRWAVDFCAVVCLTLGSSGSVAFGPDGSEARMPASRVAVVDTVGAGDSYMVGIIDAAIDAMSPQLPQWTPESLLALLERGTRFSAYTVGREGAQLPPQSAL